MLDWVTGAAAGADEPPPPVHADTPTRSAAAPQVIQAFFANAETRNFMEASNDHWGEIGFFGEMAANLSGVA